MNVCAYGIALKYIKYVLYFVSDMHLLPPIIGSTRCDSNVPYRHLELYKHIA